MSKNTVGLEEKLASVSTSYIFHQTMSSFLLLLLSHTERLSTKEPIEGYALPAEIKEIETFVKEQTQALEALLAKDMENQKDIILEACMSHRKVLISIYKHIYQYYAMWNLSSTLVADEVALQNYQREQTEEKTIDFQLFYQDCTNFIHDAATKTEQQNRISQLYKCMPFQMAREKYYAILKQSLAIAFSADSDESIAVSLAAFQDACAPETTADYGKYFSEIASWLSDQKQQKPSLLEEEALNEEYTDFQSVFSSLNQIENYLNQLYNDLNTLIILCSQSFCFSDFMEQDLIYSDLYHSVCEILSGEMDTTTAEALLETLNAQLESYAEKAIDQANEDNKREKALLSQVKSLADFSESTLKIIGTETFIRTLYYSTITDALFDFGLDETKPPATLSQKEVKFQQFIDFMKDYFSTLPSAYRKASMQALLCSLPSYMSAAELLTELRSAIEDAPDFYHKALLVDKIGNLFYEYHFATLPEKDPAIPHMHPSGCGHDYHDHSAHHTHDCGCGHPHDHI